MGTRSLTKVIEDGETIVNMYRQFDGYPSGHGKELFHFLDGITLVNGLSGDEKHKVANGAGCLAAQMVAFFKNGPGGFYLYRAGALECGQEFEYLIEVLADHRLQVTVKNSHTQVFQGSVAAFGEFCSATEE